MSNSDPMTNTNKLASEIEAAFLAVMNAPNRELSLPLNAWAERNLLKRRIAVVVQHLAALQSEREERAVELLTKLRPQLHRIQGSLSHEIDTFLKENTNDGN